MIVYGNGEEEYWPKHENQKMRQKLNKNKENLIMKIVYLSYHGWENGNLLCDPNTGVF